MKVQSDKSKEDRQRNAEKDANQVMNRNSSQSSKFSVDSSNNFMNLACKFLICRHQKEKQEEYQYAKETTKSPMSNTTKLPQDHTFRNIGSCWHSNLKQYHFITPVWVFLQKFLKSQYLLRDSFYHVETVHTQHYLQLTIISDWLQFTYSPFQNLLKM